MATLELSIISDLQMCNEWPLRRHSKCTANNLELGLIADRILFKTDKSSNFTMQKFQSPKKRPAACSNWNAARKGLYKLR